MWMATDKEMDDLDNSTQHWTDDNMVRIIAFIRLFNGKTEMEMKSSWQTELLKMSGKHDDINFKGPLSCHEWH